LVRGRRRK